MPEFTGTTDDDNIQLGGGPWTVDGDSGNDVIVTDTTDAEDDTIDGGGGADVMRGNFGNDTYYVDDVSDVVVEASNTGGIDTIYASVSYTLSNNVEILYMDGSETGIGNSGTNTIFGDSGDNVINGAGGADTMDGGGDGNDTFYVDSAGDVILNVGAIADVVNTVYSTLDVDLTTGVFVDFTDATLVGSASVDITGNAAANYLVGNAGVNTITAGAGADSLDGGAGADRLIGGDGDDAYFLDNVNDRITELGGLNSGMDTVFSTVSVNLGLGAFANLENLILTGTANINGTAGATGNAIQGNAGKNTITGGAGNDILSGGLNGAGVGGDRLVGGAGDDRYTVRNAADVVIETTGGGTDEITAYTSFSLSAPALAAQEIENLTLAGPDALNGTGNARANVIIGNILDNTLDGGKNTGGVFDTLVGGDGDDTYIIHNAGDFIDEIVDQGTDTVKADFTYTLTTFVENLVLTGTGNFNGFGNVADNTLTGNSGANTLDGLAGADTMIGGAGNDTYFVEDAGDAVSENANAGIDTVNSTIGYTLAANIENLVLQGTDDIDGTGNASNNSIRGNSGANTLDGGAGVDRLEGGLGDDTYIVDSLNDVIIDTGGTDTVQSSVNVNLGSVQYTGIENATLGGTGNTTVIGSAGANVLTGNDGNNTLDGGADDDTLIGGAGDDVFVVDGADVVSENAGEGTDTVRSSVTHILAANVENLVLTGTAAINGTGNAENNTLTGNTGVNVLTGGLGDDTYIVDALDTIVEAGGEGNDTAVFTSTTAGDTYVLGNNVENLVLGGTAAINGTGDAGANTITGNSAVNTLDGGIGNDTLDGGAGADRMVGGDGDDTFFVNMTTDVVVEAALGGTDTVNASVTYVLGGNVENLTLTGTGAINGTGDAGANTIIGNAAKNILTGLGGDDVLDGGAGADAMIGGEGSDTYIVDNIGDKITETGTLGTDTVQSSATITLAANIENLVLTGTANINGTGNADANVIDGNDGNNTLNGGAGADIMSGGLGDDTYIVDAADTVVEAFGQGNDTIISAANYSIAGMANVENITLTGTTAVTATGNTGNNTLVGNSAVNTLIGGAGDDTYYASAGDVIIELDGEGNDTLIITLSGGTFVLPDFVENIIINGTGGGTLAGDGNDNTFGGSAGNNTLDGGGGVDRLSGGGGSDTYIVDNTGDVVIELAGEGTDTVRATANYTLSANVENLILLGTGNINGTGNNLDNTITGNSGSNTLDGGTGADKLVGGAGNDTYVVDSLADLIVDGSGIDTVSTAITYTLKAGLENLVLTGTDDVNGTGNTLANTLTGNDGANSLNGGAAVDTLVGGDGNDILNGGTGADVMNGGEGDDSYVVDNINDVIVDLTGEGTDSLSIGINYTLSAAAEIENITLSGTTGLRFTGSNTDNAITGNAGANSIDGRDGDDIISGGAGNDILVGGLGDDILSGGVGIDRLTGGAGADIFKFDSAIASANADIVTDFDVSIDGDKIDISSLLADFDPLTDQLINWVQVTNSGQNSILKVNTAGTGFGAGTGYTTVATFLGITGLEGEQQLVDDGILIIA